MSSMGGGGGGGIFSGIAQYSYPSQSRRYHLMIAYSALRSISKDNSKISDADLNSVILLFSRILH